MPTTTFAVYSMETLALNELFAKVPMFNNLLAC